MRLELFGILVFLLGETLAVYSDEAFKVDWQIHQIGSLNSRNIVHHPKSDRIIALTESHVLAGLKNGIPEWRIDLGGLDGNRSQEVISYGENVITALNYLDRSIVQIWNAAQGFLISDVLESRSRWIDQVQSIDGKSFVVLYTDGELRVADGDGNLKFTGSIPEYKNAAVSVTQGGDVAIISNEKDTESVKYSILRDGELLTNKLASLSWDSIVEAYGSKLVSKHSSKYYIASLDGSQTPPKEVGLGSFEKHIPIDHPTLAAFEKGGKIQILGLDGSIKFSLEYKPNYKLTYSHGRFVLYTNSHATVINPGTGEEITSYPLDLNHSSIKGIHSASTKDSIKTLVEFDDERYGYFVDGQLIWERDEGLADVVDYTIVDFQVETSLTSDELLEEEKLNIFNAWIFRVKKHLKQLKDAYEHFWEALPDAVTQRNFDFFKTGDDNEHYFGFSKQLIFATKKGKVISIDTLTGEKLWSFDIGKTGSISALNSDGNSKVVAFLTSGKAHVLEAKSGELLETKNTPTFQSVKPVDSHNYFVELQDGTHTLYSTTEDASWNNTFFLKHDSQKVQGFRLNDKKIEATWKFEVPTHEKIVGVATKDINDKTANIGYVLGDRSALYKYLYPNLVAVATFSTVSKTLFVNILDSLTGEIIHSVYHKEIVHGNENFNIIFGEHWVVYSYWSDLPFPEQKLVVIDLFDSLKPNERIISDTASAFDSTTKSPAILSKSFVLPYKIRALGLSKTRFGVTTKSIIISLTNGQIFYLPKFILNSRRVDGRELTKEEKSEYMLLPYDPILTINDNTVISHYRQIFGAYNLISIPTNLESTTISCSYGLDIFCTRLSPSGQFDKLTPSFDKVKLVLSIILILVLIVILRPMTDSKKLKNLWVVDSA